MLYKAFFNYTNGMPLEELFYKALEAGYKRGWQRMLAKYARSPATKRYQSLLHHSINTALTGWRLAHLLGVEEKYLEPLFVGLFLHDYAKSSEEYQKMVSRRLPVPPEKVPRGHLAEDFEKLLGELGLEGWKKEIARRIALLNESPSTPYDFAEMLGAGPLPEKLLDVAVLADILNSLKGYWELGGRVSEILGKYGFFVAFHQVSIIRGIVTQLVHRAVEEAMNDKGYEPILYLADGAIYVGRDGEVPGRDEVRARLRSVLKRFLESIGGLRLGRAAFGVINQVIVKVPEYLLISDEALVGFWDYVRSLKAIERPNIDKFKSLLERRKPGADEAEIESEALKLKTLHNLWTIFNGVRQVFEERRVPSSVWKSALAKVFSEQEYDDLGELANTTPSEKAFETCSRFYSNSGLQGLSRDELVDRVVGAFLKASLEMRRYAEENGLLGELFSDALDILLDELVIGRPGVHGAAPVGFGSLYEEGKDRGVQVCVICGRRGVFEAPASLVGKGTESFLNQLPAGVRLGGSMKAKICHACRLEGSLRNLADIDPQRGHVYYVAPMFTMSPEYSTIYWRALNKALSQGNKLSLLSYDLKELILGLDGERLQPWEVARNPLKLHQALGRSEEEVLNETIRELKQEYSLEDLSAEYGVELKDWEEAARLALKKGFGDLHIGNNYSLISFAGNYIIVSAPPLGGGKEAESSKTLRRLNLALMLHLYYHAAVYVPDEALTPFSEPRPLGAARAPLKADQQSLLSSKGYRLIGGWVPIEKAEELAKVLTAAELVQNMLKGVGAEYGESGLLSLLTRPPGMILRRYVESLRRFDHKKVRDFLRYLDVLDRWWYESSGKNV